MRVLVTGSAGFIGFHVCEKLLAEGHGVVGIDNLNDYYSVALKKDRLAQLQKKYSVFIFEKVDLADGPALRKLFQKHEFTHVVNLAAQAGVRYSLTNPESYVSSNLVGFGHVLENCRYHDIQHLVYASSSSVYGMNTLMPFSEQQNVDHPISLYAATKKANELMAHTYSHLYRIPTTGLRFFTVYGPWGRPDMALHIFTSSILAGKPIPVFNQGKLQRDFTFIDDIVDGVLKVLRCPAKPSANFDANLPDPAISSAPYSIYNIGNNEPVALLEFIAAIERAIGKQAFLEFLPMQPGDVEATYANIDSITQATGFFPQTSLAEGIAQYISWHKSYYRA